MATSPLTSTEALAIHGGPKAKTTPTIPMYPGGLEIGEAEKTQVLEALDRKYLFRYYGPKQYPSKVRELEVRFAKKMGTRHALATSNCTGSLISALVACGVGPGDEVIVPGYTFFASCAAIVNAGAVPIIADTDDTLTLDLADVEKRITPLTKAILTVHMRGAPCKMDAIVDFCKKRKLILIEDTAQACGGTYKGKMLGSFGDAGCFSFQYHKIITAGEGGMLITSDDIIYDRAMGYHDTAACWRPDRFAPQRYEGELFCGDNYRMSELTGAVMLAQFDRLDGLLTSMRRNQRHIIDGIKGLPGVEVRRSHDAAGDVGICVVFYLPDASRVGRFTEALQAEGVAGAGVFNKGIPDWHIYSHWKHVLEKKAATINGGPWKHPVYLQKGGKAEYSADMCPRLLHYLGRAVQLDVPAQLTSADCDMIVKGIAKVAHAMHEGKL
jgi:8-amino-3,8-dideoxy-alpha-D-manno-octulosonate transaminase